LTNCTADGTAVFSLAETRRDPHQEFRSNGRTVKFVTFPPPSEPGVRKRRNGIKESGPPECNGVPFAPRPRSLDRVVSCQLGNSDSAYRLFLEFCWIDHEHVSRYLENNGRQVWLYGEASPVGLLEVGRNTRGRNERCRISEA
jgi:hypothetical protein